MDCSFARIFSDDDGRRTAVADTLTVLWDASPNSNVAGYLVYVGTQSGSDATTYDVGNSTSFAYPSAAPGQTYYFAVAAYFPGPLVGARSSRYPASAMAPRCCSIPEINRARPAAQFRCNWSEAIRRANLVTYGVTALPPGLALSTATGLISGTPTTYWVWYLVTAVVSDGILSDSETFTWSVAQASTPSSSAPVVTITVPTTSTSYSTVQALVTLGGTALDDSVVTDVSWTSDRGGSGTATGTSSWIAGIPLQRGPNTITVRARDDAGNVSTRAIVVKRNTGKGK